MTTRLTRWWTRFFSHYQGNWGGYWRRAVGRVGHAFHLSGLADHVIRVGQRSGAGCSQGERWPGRVSGLHPLDRGGCAGPHAQPLQSLRIPLHQQGVGGER